MISFLKNLAEVCSIRMKVRMMVGKEDTREKIDIVKLNAEIKEIVDREQIFLDV